MRDAGPSWLAASAGPELHQLRAGLRPVVRVSVGPRAAELRRWARRHGLFVSADREGFATLSPRPSTARRALELDRRPGRHALGLGLLLGYPPCCSRAASRVGEAGIDALHAALLTRRFAGKFRLVDPAGYYQGRALLSHVPCSHRCLPSLRQASRAARC